MTSAAYTSSGHRVEQSPFEVTYKVDEGLFLRGPISPGIGSALERCLRPVQVDAVPVTINPPSVDILSARLRGEHVILTVRVHLPHGAIQATLELSSQRLVLMLSGSPSDPVKPRPIRVARRRKSD